MEKAANHDSNKASPPTANANYSQSEQVTAPTNQNAGNLTVQDLIHSNIAVSRPDDAQEKEAATIATRVTSASALSSPPQVNGVSNLMMQREALSHSTTAGVGAAGKARSTPSTLNLSSTGKSLPTETLSYFNQRFSDDFQGVRIHNDSNAHRSAAQMNARAYTLGSNIVFGQGTYQPSTQTGRKTLAHELTHTIQQRNMSGGVLQRDGPIYVVTEHGPAMPLGRYTRLQQALPADQWQQLNNAAQQRGETECGPDYEPRDSITSVQTTVRQLFLPALAETPTEVTEDWRKSAFRSGMTGSGGPVATFVISQIVQAELLSRWLDITAGILDERVDISLVDPSGLAGGAATLSFKVRDMPIDTVDGGLLAGAIDRALDSQFPSLVEDVQSDVLRLQSALEHALQARAVANAIDRLIATDDIDLRAAALTGATGSLDSSIAALSRVDDIYTSEVSTLSARLTALKETGLPARVSSHETWRAAHAPDEPITVSTTRRAEEAAATQRSVMETHPALAGYYGPSTNATAMSAAIWSLFLPGQEEAYNAYTEGRISLSTYLDLDSEIRTRGAIVAGVTIAVSIATLGLGIYIAPATLGGAVLLGGTLGAIDAMTPLIVGSIYSGRTSFSDPSAQAIWGLGDATLGDIALAGGIGFGLGAAFPLAGAAISRIGSRAEAQALVLAVESGETTVLNGATIRQMGGGVLELAIPEESAVVRITRDGWQMFGPAGEEASTLLGSGSWGAGARSGGSMPAGMRGRMEFGGRSPFAFHAYDEGWGFLSPHADSPFGFGTWDDLLVPSGARGTRSPFLLGSGSADLFAPEVSPLLSAGPRFPSLAAGDLPPGAILLPNGQGMIIRRGPIITEPPRAVRGLLPESSTSGLPPGEWRISDLTTPSLRDVPASSLPYAGDRAWGRGAGNWWLYEPTSAEPVSSTLHMYRGTGDDLGMVLDVPGVTRSLHTDPLTSSSATGRGYPMTTTAMTDVSTGSRLARSHLDPHARSRPMVSLDGTSGGASTRDSLNYVGHDTRYNEWVRRTLEGRLSGSRWQAIEVWNTPRSTTGGFPIVTEEIIIQLGPDGSAQRAWRFPTHEGAFDAATDINQILGPRSGGGYEIPITEVPPTLRGSE